jgi:hypothetical protein
MKFQRADHPSKESYRLPLIKKLRKLSLMLQKREQAPKCGSNEEEKKYCMKTAILKNSKSFIGIHVELQPLHTPRVPIYMFVSHTYGRWDAICRLTFLQVCKRLSYHVSLLNFFSQRSPCFFRKKSQSCGLMSWEYGGSSRVSKCHYVCAQCMQHDQ